VAHIKLHRTDFVTFLTVDALLIIQMYLIPVFSQNVLQCAHWTESAPGSGVYGKTQQYSNRCCGQTHYHKDHANLIEQAMCL
jgi:hypothetical protein